MHLLSKTAAIACGLLVASTFAAGVALAQQGDGGAASTQPAGAKRAGDPYTLATCPVSGEKLDADAMVKVYDGREVRFCCGGCIKKFDGARADYIKVIDAEMTKRQRPYSPATCIISSEPLVEDGEDVAVEMVYANRLVRLCCGGCVKTFKKDPAAHLAKLDKAVTEMQRADYPLDVCVVSEQKLGSMGDPVERVVGNRLVRLCCKGCVKRLDKAPAKYLAVVDEAWAKRGDLKGHRGEPGGG